jgi:hypothetical protein
VTRKNLFLYVVIFLEGYAVLSAELLFIRQLLPYVGNATDTVAVIIAAVLLPLAVGYYVGGHAHIRNKKTIRALLLRNFFNVAVILMFGLSALVLELLFYYMNTFGLTNRVLQTMIFSVLFVVYPVFVLGQTVPLVSHYFPKEKLASAAGKILFFSTAGSFAGALLSTLVLMVTIGVQQTALVTLAVIVIMLLMLARLRRHFLDIVLIVSLAVFAFFLHGPIAKELMMVVSDNPYGTVQIIKEEGKDYVDMKINRNLSARYTKNKEKRHHYVAYIEDVILTPLRKNTTVEKILILGAGGFTMGYDDHQNTYHYVDINPDLKEVSEKYLLPRPLGANKKFFPQPARSFLLHSEEAYDLIILDVYLSDIPGQLITKEFFLSVKKHLAPGGMVVFNAVASPLFQDEYSRKLDRTFRSVFPLVTRQVVQRFNPWEQDRFVARNVLYLYRRQEGEMHTGIYTDDHNTYFWDAEEWRK